MLRDSLKWMAIVLFIVALLAFGAYRLLVPRAAPSLADAPPVNAAASPAAAEPTSTPAITDTPAPSPTLTPTPTPVPTAVPAQNDVERFIRARIADMTLSEKLGQLVMFGFVGTSRPSSEFSDIFETYHIGNVVLYGSNINSGNSDGGFGEAETLTGRVNKLNQSDIPLLISIDIEGGTVVRFRWSPWPSSARTLGRNGDEAAAHEQFYYIGTRLKSIGINTNLAPVLDIAPSPMDTFLTTRIISSNPDTAASIGCAIIEGLSDADCLSTAKHFPGHGGTTKDSHEVTPVVDKSLDEMLSYDLIPFAEAVQAGVDLVLVAHISYPQLDPNHIATQSYAIISGLLRQQLGFSGVIMSDDFRMNALTSQTDVGDAAVTFINAGGDLILCGAVPEKQRAIMDALTAAAEDGTLSEARIDESVYRILEKKLAVCDWPIG